MQGYMKRRSTPLLYVFNKASLYNFLSCVTAEQCFGNSLKHSTSSKRVKQYYVNVAEGDGISHLLLEKGCLYLSCIIVRAISK